MKSNLLLIGLIISIGFLNMRCGDEEPKSASEKETEDAKKSSGKQELDESKLETNQLKEQERDTAGIAKEDSIKLTEVREGIYTNEPNMYHPDFLAKLDVGEAYERYSFVDGQMWMHYGEGFHGRVDTIDFPEVPALNQPKILKTTSKDNMRGKLKLERINYTSVAYHLTLEKGTQKHEQKDTVHLGKTFFLGAEQDESSISGYSYSAVEYFRYNDKCPTTLRLGYESNSGDGLLAKIMKDCNEPFSFYIGLEDFPTFQEQIQD